MIAPTATGYISIQQAAEAIGAKPWDVVRLMEAGLIRSVVLVDSESLATYKERNL